jgi:hypothetical protein
MTDIAHSEDVVHLLLGKLTADVKEIQNADL